ncbi:MAG TPA: hypothetical protein VIV11_22240 [Kofleriaceae bacterium]
MTSCMRVPLALVFLATPALALADERADDPCIATVIDPIVTPVRDVDLDAQRSACLRQELEAGLLAHALIDTPGFYGSLGGDLALGGRVVIREAHELSAQLRVVDFSFVQNAVNKVTHAGFGPLVIGAAAGGFIGVGARGALVAQLELPFTRNDMDTVHISGQLGGVVTGRIAPRFVLHARLGALGMRASSVAGATNRLAFRAGSDVVWHLRTRLALLAGADLSAGWYHGFDHVLLRLGVHWRVTRDNDWRLRAGIGAPVGGDERANAVLDLAVVHGL